MNSETAVVTAFAFAVSTLCACEVAPVVGDKPGYVPPKLVYDSNHALIWDNPSAFGPVPADLVPEGAKICGRLNTNKTQYIAIGYHPRALGTNGKPLPGGGYFCATK